ncbi:hypothetical protein BC833DRAFT_521720 [Globomyces pollinis-pini]|nr:hypothetical protein BC833DRAFT_521720 [Globomyces pollinis-pini]
MTGFDHSETIQDLFAKSVARFPNNQFLGTRYPSKVDDNVVWGEYVWKSYEEVDEDRSDFGCGLMEVYDKHVSIKGKWFLGIMSINRYEWLVTDLGAGAFNIPNVALYESLGPDAAEYILNHAEIPIVVASIDKVASLLDLKSNCPHLKVIIVLESLMKENNVVLDDIKTQASSLNVEIFTFNDVIKLGKTNPRPFQLPTAGDVACLSYTSGTTGTPKAAILSQGNFICGTIASHLLPINEHDVHFSFLPLAHIYEKMNIINCFARGASLGFFSGSIPDLMKDVQELKPTVFVAVPRLLNKIYDKIMQATVQSDSYVKSSMVSQAISSKLYYLKHYGTFTHSIWDSLVFNNMKQVFGGRVRIICSGSAPISSDILNFYRILISGPVCEGYGQTETCAAVTMTWPSDFEAGQVGAPLTTVEVKLVSVPEMGYHAKEMKGEIWLRGGSIFKGYYKDEEKTKEAINEDGWLQTGDIGRIDHAGRISIIDRKKNIFKLSQGEYVAPEKIEIILGKSPFVGQLYVHGDSLQSQLVAVVVPDQEYCVPYAIKQGWLEPTVTVTPQGEPASEEFVQLCKKPEFQKVLLEELTQTGKSEKLRGFEMIKAIHVDAEMFSLENEMLTPTFKLKRPLAAKKYRAVIDEMYANLSRNKA